MLDSPVLRANHHCLATPSARACRAPARCGAPPARHCVRSWYFASQCLTVAVLRPTASAICVRDAPSATSVSNRSRLTPPLGAYFSVPTAASPCLLSQYATVDSWRPTRLPISASDSPSPSNASNDVRSMHCIVAGASDGKNERAFVRGEWCGNARHGRSSTAPSPRVRARRREWLAKNDHLPGEQDRAADDRLRRITRDIRGRRPSRARARAAANGSPKQPPRRATTRVGCRPATERRASGHRAARANRRRAPTPQSARALARRPARTRA